MRAEGQVTYIQAHEEKLIDEGKKIKPKAYVRHRQRHVFNITSLEQKVLE